jgi:hypothetical protein
MEALSMLRPDDRTVRGKLQLYLRLWMARQKYEQLRPFGDTSADRIRFHLEQLRACWDQVISFQQALGMEVVRFSPTDKFEFIYVITSFVERDLSHRSNTILNLPGRWKAYQDALKRLNHGLNPYDFADACARCHKLILEITTPSASDTSVDLIRLPRKQTADAYVLKMKAEPA